MRVPRIVAVAGGLAAGGAVAGAAVGAAIVAVWMMDGPVRPWENPVVVAVGAALGGAMGAVLGPAAAWLLLRHVPLGRAVAFTSAGTLLAALVGMMLGPPFSSFAPFVGFALSAAAVRRATPRLAPPPDLPRSP